MRTKVSLEGEGLSFGEIYMNGGTLDLSGLTLKFDQIKANSNNVFITSSKAGANLNLENKQNYLYHGNIYNKEGVFKAENAKLNFQGHPSIHAYVSEKQAKKLQEQGLSALTKPVSFAQEDWEDRVFVLKELNLDQSKFYLERNASLKVENLNAKNSKIELGSKHLWIDEKDGENITDKVQDSFYGDTAQTGVGKEMGFEQKL
ncbi:hypothetical protein B10583_12480 [Campylobacter jejuni]|nr:hypothetical protein B10091_01820 [Campylobacter jejuni]GML65876.1 hypothetical protein B10583_12480 [Campylobacter jejuni]GML74619.1 hypothetical protein B11533_12490 [Campylobacter jejuni]